jgi:hypothetical protein
MYKKLTVDKMIEQVRAGRYASHESVRKAVGRCDLAEEEKEKVRMASFAHFNPTPLEAFLTRLEDGKFRSHGSALAALSKTQHKCDATAEQIASARAAVYRFYGKKTSAAPEVVTPAPAKPSPGEADKDALIQTLLMALLDKELHNALIEVYPLYRRYNGTTERALSVLKSLDSAGVSLDQLTSPKA